MAKKTTGSKRASVAAGRRKVAPARGSAKPAKAVTKRAATPKVAAPKAAATKVRGSSSAKSARRARAKPARRTSRNPGTLRAPSRKTTMLNSTHVEGTMVDGVLVAKLKCEKLGEYEAGIVQGDISNAAKGTSWKVALDFTDVQLISSVGLGLIVTLNKAAKTNKGRMSMFNLNPNLLNLFKITRLDSGLLIKTTAAEAIAAVK
ncbi:MAG: STAS domain-containing protein [Phycisphaerales bacterium]|nr:STAS domain-containing protein [Phycisphaerales bacterium]